MQASFHIYCGRSTERLGQNHHTLGREMENPELHSLEFWVTDCKHKRLDFVNFKQGVLTSPLQKNLVNPTETRTTTWQGINPLDNGIMVPQRAWTPAKPVPDLGLFWLWRWTVAILIFCLQKSEAAFPSLPPTPLRSHRCHCTGHHPQTKTATTQAGVQVSFWPQGSLGHEGTLDCGWGVALAATSPPPLSRKTKHTCKAHWVRCTHTPRCAKEQMLSEKEKTN